MRIRHNIGVIKKFYFKRTKKGTDFNIKIAKIKYFLCSVWKITEFVFSPFSL